MPPRKRKPKIALESPEVVVESVQSPIATPPEPSSPAVFNRPSRPKSTTIMRGILFALVVGSVSSAVYFYRAYNQAALGKSSTKEIESVVEVLAEIVDLPNDEVPTFATVTDATKLTEQSFFARSKNGDKVLIYSKNGLAYLYRPENRKLINIAPIGNASLASPTPVASAAGTTDSSTASQTVLGATTEVATAEPETSPEASVTEVNNENPSASTIRVVLLNGSAKAGVTHAFETDFLAGEQNIEILEKLPAAHDNYQRTIVVDITKKATSFAQSLAQEIGSSVEELPADEKIPEGTDIVVIVGNDRI